MPKRLSIKDAIRIAKNNEGVLLSKIYINSKEKLTWKCKFGHIFEMHFNSIQNGHWCPKCRHKVPELNEIKIFAKQKYGRLLSKNYINSHSQLEWQCHLGHIWNATWSNIKKGYWCPICAGQGKETVENLQQLAKNRGGILISETVGNAKQKLKWKCKHGHLFISAYPRIKSGGWCPDCSSGLGERICRVFFEQIFSKKFPKKYPKWLKSEDGNQLELDGYCEDLGIAFEHQGRQHYAKVGFTKCERDLKKRQEYDEEKRKFCEKNNVVLIEIPEIGSFLKVEKVKSFLKEKFQELSILPSKFDAIQIKLEDAYSPNNEELLQELKDIATLKKGELLSTTYLGSMQKHKWKCANNHEWQATPNKIKNGIWCPKCVGKNKTIEDMQNLAKENEGQCLSSEYNGKNIKLKWKCSKGHIFEMTPNSVISGHWCQKCAKNDKKSIIDMQEIAISKGGKCLSEYYENARTVLSWQCKEGHQWEAPYSRIIKSWCYECAGNKAKSIQYVQELIREKEGLCLSNEYKNIHQKLKFQCKKNHTFLISTHQIIQGQWCSECAGNKKLTIEDMRKLASEKGGKCLSTEYFNNKEKLIWECSERHRFELTPDKVKNRGQWCKICKI